MHNNDDGLIWEKRMLQQIQIRHQSLGHSNEHRKGLWHPFVMKAQNNNGQTYLNTVKATHHKPMVNFILSGENLNAFPQRSGRRQGCLPTFHSSSVRSLSFSYRVKAKGKSGWEGEKGGDCISLLVSGSILCMWGVRGGANLQPLSHNKRASQVDFEFAVAWAI